MALIDEMIQDAMRKGHFADLPGTGKPLKLEDESHVPQTMRMANKMLIDNGYVPDWMAQGQELDAARDALVTEARCARSQQRIEALRERAGQYNKQVLIYNLKVPKGVAHKRHFDVEGELRKLR